MRKSLMFGGNLAVQGWFNPLMPSSNVSINEAPIISSRGDALAGRYIYIENPGLASVLYSYKWQKNGVDISGETGTMYLIRYADEGTSITAVKTLITGQSVSSNSISVEVLFSNSYVLDAVVPTLGVTFTGTKVSALAGVKSVFSFSNGTDAQRPTINDFYGGKMFKITSGTQKLISAAAFPQNSVYFASCFYGTNGDITSNKTSTGYVHASVQTNLVKWRNSGGDVLAGTRTLTSNSGLHTGYWEFNYNTGFQVGNDGTFDSSNSTAIASAPSGTFNFLNGGSGANAFVPYVGVSVWFTRALTAGEWETWSRKIKAYNYYGYAGQLPFEGGQDGMANVVLAGLDVKDWNSNDPASAIKSYYDISKTIVKNADFVRLENPQRAGSSTALSYETTINLFENATAVGMTRTITQSQAFTFYAIVCIRPNLQPPVTTNRIFHYLNGSDLVVLYVDQATGKVKMQSQGAIGTSGIENDAYEPFKNMIIKAVFNNASSVLTIDIDGTEYEVTGSLGGTTGLAGSVEFGENLSGSIASPILYNGTPTTDENTAIMNFLRAYRRELPDYSKGHIIRNITDWTTQFTIHDAFGGWCKMSDGSKRVVFRSGSNHVSNDGDLTLASSVDNYASVTTILDTSVVFGSGDSRDPRIMRMSSGRLIVNFFKNPYPSECYVIYSDDNGSTWSTPKVVDSGGTYYDIRCSGPVIQLPNGDLLLASHVEESGGLNLQVVFWRSSDGGDTWSYDSEIDDPNPGVATDFEEVNMILLANGQIFAAIRYEEGTSNKSILKAFGTVSGSSPITWSAVTTSTTVGTAIFGSPGCVQLASGRILLVARLNLFQYPGGLFYSDDNGVTFTQGKFPEPTLDFWVYGSPIENTDGTLEMLYFMQTEAYNNSVGTSGFGKSYGKVVPLLNYE